MNSLDCGKIISMPYKALLADPDTETVGTIRPNIYLETLYVADILLVFLTALQTQVQPVKYFARVGVVTSLCSSSDYFFIRFNALLMLSSTAFSFSSISFSMRVSTSIFLKLKTIWSSYS